MSLAVAGVVVCVVVAVVDVLLRRFVANVLLWIARRDAAMYLPRSNKCLSI